MKKIFLIVLAVAGLWACNNSKDSVFDASIPTENITFTARPGGAIMTYKIDDPTIFGVKVRYTDELGKSVTMQGSYSNNALTLGGFNKAQTDVPVQISLINERGEESQVFQMKFNTQESAAYAFFNGIQISPYWEGFQITYNAPDDAQGLANIYYMGLNPMTQQVEPLLLETFLIQSGGGTKVFPLKQIRDKNTVIITTEDFKGNIARTQQWDGILSYNVEKLDNSGFQLLDPLNLSIEGGSSVGYAGTKYLFDGDIKGTQRMKEIAKYPYYSFIAGPWAKGKYWILDVQQELVASAIRIYAILDINAGQPGSWSAYTSGTSVHKLPSEVTVYASNNKDAAPGEWKRVGYYYESPVFVNHASRWYSTSSGGYPQYTKDDRAIFADASPAYMTVSLDVTTDKYRYYKIEVNNLFQPSTYDYYVNNREYVSFHELEVFGKK